jgi:hypothetical protein
VCLLRLVQAGLQRGHQVHDIGLPALGGRPGGFVTGHFRPNQSCWIWRNAVRSFSSARWQRPTGRDRDGGTTCPVAAAMTRHMIGTRPRRPDSKWYTPGSVSAEW